MRDPPGDQPGGYLLYRTPIITVIRYSTVDYVYRPGDCFPRSATRSVLRKHVLREIHTKYMLISRPCMDRIALHLCGSCIKSALYVVRAMDAPLAGVPGAEPHCIDIGFPLQVLVTGGSGRARWPEGTGPVLLLLDILDESCENSLNGFIITKY